MRNDYIALMEKTLSAYSDSHIQSYFDNVKTNGLKEHGFPRLTANIGILIAHGRRHDLIPIFMEMMDLCCEQIPRVKAANDFSVREIICCIWELEAVTVISAEKISYWKDLLSTIVPEACYSVFATTPTSKVRNWALFTAVSEFARQKLGVCHSEEFIDIQLASQLQWIDENGMYMDNCLSKIHQPMMYDLVPRGLFCTLLSLGYRGKYYQTISDLLKKAGLLTLKLQSANGDIPFGGRSNQFLLSEGWLIAICEFEACRYFNEGNIELAKEFKTAAARALSVCARWLEKEPIRHIKNRFPTETKYGCENYAYFDKYMITTASLLHSSYLLCNDDIPINESIEDTKPSVCSTSKYFHKLQLKCGGYTLEFDTSADPHYDASGLGRIHRVGAPTEICLSVPCPAEPAYFVPEENKFALSLCPAVKSNGEWFFATREETKYDVRNAFCDHENALAEIDCVFPDGKAVTSTYSVNEDGVKISVRGNGEIAFMLPAFHFDGENYTDIAVGRNTLTVGLDSWECRYSASGSIIDLNFTAANRNGLYRAFAVTGTDEINICVEIVKA